MVTRKPKRTSLIPRLWFSRVNGITIASPNSDRSLNLPEKAVWPCVEEWLSKQGWWLVSVGIYTLSKWNCSSYRLIVLMNSFTNSKANIGYLVKYTKSKINVRTSYFPSRDVKRKEHYQLRVAFRWHIEFIHLRWRNIGEVKNEQLDRWRYRDTKTSDSTFKRAVSFGRITLSNDINLFKNQSSLLTPWNQKHTQW
jgi:hypothetical protein